MSIIAVKHFYHFVTFSLDKGQKYNVKIQHDIVRAASIIIRDKNGNFFIHQRNSCKKLFPNLFGIGAGGHIENGETIKEAAERELFEETGLKTSLKYLFKVNYKSESYMSEMNVFETVTEIKELNTDNGEWQWSGWMKKEEVDKLFEDKKLCPDTAMFYEKYQELSVASWPQAAEKF